MRHDSLDRLALSATLHCLTGCAVGEILGLVLGLALGVGSAASIALAVALAFLFGYALTLRPLLASGLGWTRAARLALASDTLSIALMETVDNLVMVAIPGALHAGPASLLFWGSMAISLAIAGAAAFPLNRGLIARGQGHAKAHAHAHRSAGGHGATHG
jgi:hypothetical protein